MGTVYGTAVGTPPVCTSMAFRGWVSRLIAYRLAECPVARATTYYFSQSGNDTTGAGTLASPWKTIAKANTVIAANPSGNIALLFARGDVWRETVTNTATIASGGATTSITLSTAPVDIPVGDTITLTGGTQETKRVLTYNDSTKVLTLASVNGTTHTGISYTIPATLNVTAPNVTIGAYSPTSGAAVSVPPCFSAWVIQANNTFSVVSGTPGVWQVSTTRGIAWFRENSDVNNVYVKMSSLAEVATVAGSWWWDSSAGLLYVRPFEDLGPRTVSGIQGNVKSYEVCYSNNSSGIILSTANGTRIDGVRVDGYGLSSEVFASSNLSTRPYGIASAALNDTNTVVISNTEVYFSVNHTIGVLGNSSGGIITLKNCTYGWGSSNGDAVSYNINGGQEFILDGCECVGSLLPSGLQPHTFTNSGSPVIAHTSNNLTYTLSLFLARGCKVRTGPYQSWGLPTSGAPSTWTDLKDCRAWVIDCETRARTQTLVDRYRMIKPCNSTTAGDTTVTLTAPVTQALGLCNSSVPQYLMLSGGASQPERLQASSYNPATGVITLSSGNTVAASGRITAEWEAGRYNQSSYVGGNVSAGDTTSARNIVCINCLIENRAVFGQTTSSFANVVSNLATLINCTILVDLLQSNGTGGDGYSFTGWINRSGATPWLYNCRLHFRVGGRQRATVELTCGAGGAVSAMKVMNCIVGAEIVGDYNGTGNNGGAFIPGINNDATKQKNNAYCNASVKTGNTGYSNDPYYVELSSVPPLGSPPGADSPLVVAAANNQLVEGYRLEYDANWQPRNSAAPVIGPLAVPSIGGRIL